MKYYLGIDIGATSFKSGIVDINNDIIYQNSIRTNYEQTNNEALNNLSELIDDAVSKYPVESIGVGVPCVVNEGKVKMAPNIPNWNDIDFGTYLRTKYLHPVAIDNDANAAAFAELIAGKGQKLDNFVYITLGTGVGGAIIINKNIYRGRVGGAGEIGHIVFDPITPDIDVSYRNGALETMLGRYGIIENYKKLCKEHNIAEIENIDVKDICELAEKKNDIAKKTIDIAGIQLGIAIATINHILDIKHFIIGGGISQSKYLLNVAEFIARDRTLPSVSKIKIQQAKYIQNTGIIGAALLGKMRGKIKIEEHKVKMYEPLSKNKTIKAKVFGENLIKPMKRVRKK